MGKLLASALWYAKNGWRIDARDEHLLSEYHWWLDSRGYIRCKSRGKVLLLHRVIMGVSNPKIFVDHINGVRTDNRHCNLRLATPAINRQNLKPQANRGTAACTTSAGNVRYRAQAEMRVNGTRNHVHLGYYSTREEAANVARQWRLANMPGATS